MACARASCVNARCDGKHDEVVIIVSSEGIEFEKPPQIEETPEPATIQMPRWFTDAIADAEAAEALPSDPVESVTVRPSADFGNVESGSSSRSEAVSESEDLEEERRPEPERKPEQRSGPVKTFLKKAKKAMSKSKKKDRDDQRPAKGKGGKLGGANKFGGKPKKGKK